MLKRYNFLACNFIPGISFVKIDELHYKPAHYNLYKHPPLDKFILNFYLPKNQVNDSLALKQLNLLSNDQLKAGFVPLRFSLKTHEAFCYQFSLEHKELVRQILKNAQFENIDIYDRAFEKYNELSDRVSTKLLNNATAVLGK